MGDVFRDGRFVADEWVLLEDADAVPADGPVFVSLSRWKAERERLAGRNAALGVVIRAGEKVEELAADLDRFAEIAIEFPAFSDGRGYSTARMLREEYGYNGTIRAIGDVLIDQIALMRRCGVDAFVVSHAPTRARLEQARVPEVTLYYQPTGSGRQVPAGTRPWARKAAG